MANIKETKEEKEARLAKEAQEKAEAKAKADAAKAKADAAKAAKSEEDDEKKPARYVIKSDLLHSGKSYKKGKHIKESDENFKHFQALGHLRKLAAYEVSEDTEQA